MKATVLALLAALALSACVDDQVQSWERRFDPDHLLEVELELAPADWERLRHQTRSWLEVYGNCLAAPFPSPFDDVPATVTVDGVRHQQASVRKKGFLGSLSVDKPSLKIELPDSSRLTLNNAQQDPSYLRQCLSYRIFAAAGIPAPRCNFARVRVNGDDLGLYVHVEAIDREFLARHFDDDRGNLYEGTYSDFRDGWTETFELETNQATGDRRDLDAVVAALERPDAELVAALEAVVALDPLITYWAVEALIGNRDGFAGNANNFFAYHDPTSDRFELIPWGADTAFAPGIGAVRIGSLAPWRLYQLPATRDRYVATLRRVLDEVWDEDALVAEIDRMAALIAPIVDAEVEVDALRRFVRGRRAEVVAELDAGPPVWSTPLPDPPCLDTLGEITGSLQTTWGSGLAGDGSLLISLAGVPLDIVEVGAAAGWDPDAPSRARIQVVATLADGTVELVIFQLDAGRLRPGASLAIDGVVVAGTVFHHTPATGAFVLVGLVADGTLELAAVATVDGAAVGATFTGTLVRSPF